MHYQNFIERLPNLYDCWGDNLVNPKSQKFAPIIKQVKGITSANVMQLLNCAVACLEPNEVYCEVGCFQGASLIAALLEHPEQIAYAVDNFSEFDVLEDSFDKLLSNLAAFSLDEQVIFCHQDVEEFFCELQASQIEEKIGLYFYDGATDYRSRLMGLLLVKPFLAQRSVIILSNSNWESAQQATLDFIAAHPQSQLILDFSSANAGNYTLWNGLQVISWEVTANHQRDWSSFQKLRKPDVINSIYKLQSNSRQQIIEAWYKDAIALYICAKYDLAKQKYKQVLTADINRADAWYNLGRLYYQTERYQEAVDCLLKALELDASNASWHYNLGSVLEKLGAIPQAIQAYQQAVSLDSNWISAYNNLGNIWFEAGELELAEAMYRQVVAACPKHCAGYINLGNVLMERQEIDGAIETYEKALSLKPNDPDILYNLGIAYEAKNDSISASNYLGLSCYRQGQYREAIAYLHKVLESQTGDIEFYLVLADSYHCLNRYEESIKYYREGIDLYPEAETLYFNLSLALQDTGSPEEAAAVLTEGLQVLPDNVTLKLHKQLRLPILYESLEEIEAYRQNFTRGLKDLIQQTQLDTPEAIQSAFLAVGSSTNFYLQYQGKNDLELQMQYGEFVHRVMAANYPQWTKTPQLLPLNEGEKIRIGYISAYMRTHTVGKLMFGLLKYHTRQDFEFYCYYTGCHVDSKTREFQLASDVFHHIPDNLEAACQQIVDDKLHVLVFTDIGMNAPISIMAGLRLAPVQCVSWGHPITSGLPTIDYYLSSELMEPANAREHYSETLVCLPNIGICYEKPDIPEATKSRSEFHLRDEAIVYLSCQSLYKYLPQYDYIFPAIAQQVPQAQFIFLSHFHSPITEKFRQRLKRAFERFNLESENYCIIAPRQDWIGYCNLNLISDIFLDTLSWSGGNTTLEAIACNLPIVTCPGEFMRGRHSYGILKMLGVTETIAETEAEYIDIAVRLGLDPAWRTNIVQRMKERYSYLYEDKICVAVLEELYRRVVRESQRSLSPNP